MADAMIVDHTDVGAAFRRLSVPNGIQMLGDQLLGIVDTIAIGSMGTAALAGATAASVVAIAVGFSLFGLMTGTSILCAQRIGANDLEGFGRTVRAGAVVPFIVAIAICIAGFFGAKPVLHALVGSLPSADASAWYLIWRCLCIVPIVISGTLIVGVAAAGNRILGILVLALINLVHIPLLLVLGLGWWTHHPYGVEGAGLSSFISEAIAALFAIAYVAYKPAYRIFSSWKISLALARDTALLGLPEAVFLLGVMLPDIAIVAMLAPLGPTIVGAFRALNVVSDLTFVVPSPLQAAAQTVIGQRLGARDPEGAKVFLHKAQRLSVLVTAVTGAGFAACAWPLAYLFTLNPVVATLAALPLALHMATLPLKGWSMVSMAPIRASGDTRFSMIVGLICAGLVIPFAYVGIEHLHLGLFSVPIGWIAAWAVRAVVTAIKLRKGSWMRRAPLAAA